MAIAAACIWEVRTAGLDTNGGGFVAGASGSDWSQQNGKRTGADVTDISTTDAVANGTTTITSATANFATTIIGNTIYLQGGTGALSATRRQVTARASATSITVDATVATGTGITMNIGGALISPGEASRTATGSNTIWIKAGTYTLASASPNVATGCVSTSAGVNILGYETTRGDFTATRPLLQANGSITSFNIISLNSSGTCRGINLDGNSRSGSRGVLTSAQCLVMDCNAVNFTGTAFQCSQSVGIRLKASGCSTTTVFSMGDGNLYDCIAKDNTITGFTLGTSASLHRCIADSNTGASQDGFSLQTGNLLVNCVSYGNGRDGFRIAGAGDTLINCIAQDNDSGTGFNVTPASNNVVLVNNAAYSNSTDFSSIGTNVGSFAIGSITLSGSPFNNAASSDFSLNNTASAGASCRAAGIPGISPDGLTTGYLDIGYAQHQDSGGASGEHSAVF